MTKGIVISLYDYTGEALKPWAEAGYECYAFDIQHTGSYQSFESGGAICFENADLHVRNTYSSLMEEFEGQNVVFGMGFPVCTDLAVSGARHFAKKEEANPGFQDRAVGHAKMSAQFFEELGCPYFIENPVSVLSTKWRKPNHTFHPWQYGGYIPDAEAEHPTWPKYIAPRDAYPKKTCLWTGNGFVMPQHKPVEPEPGYSRQYSMLRDASMRTKNIRSATPRGFARAVFEANKEG